MQWSEVQIEFGGFSNTHHRAVDHKCIVILQRCLPGNSFHHDARFALRTQIH
jgi:hypothetical protein